MRTSQRFWRGLFFFVLIAALCGGLALPVTGNVPVHAAPRMRVSSDIVISEFRTRGPAPNAGTNEFIEIYNLSSSPANIAGWKISYSSNAGTTSDRYVFPGGSSLSPGQYFLLANSTGYSGSVTPDATYTVGLADDGGIAVLDAADNVIDEVGMSAGSAYKEPSDGSGILAPMPADTNQSYQRTPGGAPCNDTDNNAADFVLATSDPQNSSSTPLPCLGVIGVDAPDGTYAAGDPIDITIAFSDTVNVTGFPTLVLETGVTDHSATYLSGSGSSILTFHYVVQTGDATSHLDYVATDSLKLSGGSIRGVIGNALLTLPAPGAAGSLGANSNIVINNNAAPSVVSFQRQSPASTPTNNDTLTFRATFSEPVTNVDPTDFEVTAPGTTGVPSAVTQRTTSVYDVTVSGGDLAGFNGTVGLNLSATENIADLGGIALPRVEPPAASDETYAVDNTLPAVTISLASGQNATTGVMPVNFTVVFSEPIVVTGFTVSAIRQTGTASSVTWNITDSGDHTTFALSATSLSSNGTLIPSISAGRVTDPAGNPNTASIDSTVTYTDTTGPSVTINQASGQRDPTTSVPVQFDVVFSEQIQAQFFTPGDITQNGTAVVNTWTITDLGDHRRFTVAATSITGTGTVIPSIAANQVWDLVRNPNSASTSTDNRVVINSTNTQSVVISEFRTNGPRGPNDEFIELYNPTNNYVDISGWKVNASNDSGSTATRATIPASTILRSGQYYLIANNASNGYSGSVPPDLTYTNPITDGGGIALFKPGNSTPMDAVGLGTGSAYKEAPVLAPLTGNTDRSYERKLGGLSDSCQDTNNNANDFQVIPNSSPQNYSEPLRLCGNTGPSLITSTITIASDSPDPSLVYGYVKVAVRVRADSFQPSGALVNITATGLTTGCTIHLSTAGNGACTIRFTSVGAKTIRATFLGDNNHLSSKDTESHDVFVTTPTKYRTRTPTPAPPPPLVAINEFLPRPGHDWNHDGVVNTGDEYIELLNHGVVDVNLQGYKLDDEVNIGSNPFSLPSTILKPGERIVFYGSQTGLLLGDGGDAVRLLKPNGQLADAYNYSVVRFPDQSYCRLPDNGGLDDWNEFCFPTPGLPNSLSQNSVSSPTGDEESLCPIADTLPQAFAFAECSPFGKNIWNSDFWDRTGWFDEKNLPESPGKSPVFAD